MKKLFTIALCLCASSLVSQAVILDVNSATNTSSASNQGSSNAGALVASLVVTDNTTSPQNQQFTISGLTLDGTGTGDDSVVVNFVVSAVGGNLQTNATGAGWLSAGDVNLNANGEYVKWTFDSLDVKLGGVSNAAATANASFLGFDGVTMGAWSDGEAVVVNGTLFTGVGGSKIYAIPFAQDIQVIYDTSKGATGSWRPLGVHFQIDTSAGAPLPVIGDFTSSSSSVDSGDTVTLNWTVSDADTLTLDQGIGDVTGSTSQQVTVAANTTYTLTATNSNGSSTAKVTVSVDQNKLNILFILVDDWGWTDHSNAAVAQGHQSAFYQTPNFTRLVDEGVALASTYAQPNCAPTRAALLTGQYSPRHGNGVYNVASLNRPSGRTTYTTPADQGNEYANGDEQTIIIAEAFKAAGYVTAHFGKYHAGASNPSNPTYHISTSLSRLKIFQHNKSHLPLFLW